MRQRNLSSDVNWEGGVHSKKGVKQKSVKHALGVFNGRQRIATRV